ncbi:MAG: hypothetical protein HZB56_06595 [Deltaproteobacteria bacterium]|nr:hypothetical protein [Deltaproteobacteria bacterium]
MPRLLASLLAALVSSTALAGEPAAPPSAADLTGARSLSLGAGIGITGGNEGMFTNPGTLAARRRYAMEAQYLDDRLDGARRWQWAQGSVVDSETSPVTGGFAYARIFAGEATGSLYHLAMASPVSGGLYAGVTGKYLSIDSATGRKTRAVTVDAGLYWQASQLVGLGVAGYNLVPIGNRQDAAPGMGAGFSVGDGRRFLLAGDWRRDFERAGKSADAWAAGAEVMLLDALPLRAGWQRDEIRRGSFWSAGLGFVAAGAGVAVDLAYRQGIEAPRDRTAMAALKIFIATPQ